MPGATLGGWTTAVGRAVGTARAVGDGRARVVLAGIGLLLLAVPFLSVVDTFYRSDDLGIRLFGATALPGDFSWLPSRRWNWHRPVPAYTWLLTHRYLGTDVVWWHLPNVVLHVVNTLLAGRLAWRLGGSRAAAVLTAAFFAWSPAAPGTVNWISARPDLMATMFALATFCAAYSPRLSSRPVLQVVAVAACVVLSVSSKESAFALLAGLRFASQWTVAALLAVLPPAHLTAASMPLWEWDRFFYFAAFWFAGGLATCVVSLARTHLAIAALVLVLVVTGYSANIVQRTRGVREAATISASLESVLAAARSTLPAGTTIWCGNLPDHVASEYAYRNGCEEHIRWHWPGAGVVGVRYGTRPVGPSVYVVAPDGASLWHAAHEAVY